MGNNSSSSFTLCKACFVISCCTKQIKNHKAIQVVKRDGKVLTFTNNNSPILVKDVLAKLSKDIDIGIGLSKELANNSSSSANNLPLDYELKAGKVYYVLYNCIKNDIIDDEYESKSGANCKRVKIVITRQQLNELLAKQISVEKVLLLELEKQEIMKNKNIKRVFSNVSTKSCLESIPENIEF